MKTTKLNRFMVLIFLLIGQKSFGQNAGIDSLKVIPENATGTDEIKVICYSTFSHGGCDLVNHSVTFQGNQITLSLEHELGMLTYICHSIDTISLGNLNQGDYQLHANLIIHPMDAIVDWDTVSFSINGPLGFDNNSQTASLKVYPNPFDREFHIKTDQTIEKIEISSVSGQKMILKETSGFKEKTIDLSDLNNGMYLLIITDTKGNKYTKTIFKNSL